MVWVPVNIANPVPVFEVPNSSPDEPWELYAARYSNELEPNEHQLGDIKRHRLEIFKDFEPGSSIMVFGSGHSFLCNAYAGFSGNFSITAVDVINEASTGLSEKVSFINTNILKEDLPGSYDYAFSSHVLEHFTRKDLFSVVLPKIMRCVKKTFVILVPYEDAWKDEITHRCRFYYGDELMFLATKYKIIRLGVSLVLWVDREKYDKVNGKIHI